eukprot:TRINITY_DN6099_c0_g1_i2.p1 TRINITY_DN6099_c0_g1~~TRINITY_DN6099_c0_g1_i2.p1  ORF type:complete len:466 (-),score=85.04 TRINITY_DN6099_c0_g1_i2:1-1398(-)
MFKSSYKSCLKDININMPTITSQLDSGVRCLEIDLHTEGSQSIRDFSVGLSKPGDAVNAGTKAKPNPKSHKLGPWLEQINIWSDKNPQHSPITIVFNIRDEMYKYKPLEGSITQLMLLCEKMFPKKIFQKHNYDLTKEWPSVSDMTEKILIVMSGNLKTRLFCLHDVGFNPSLVSCKESIIEVHNTRTGHLFYWSGKASIKKNGEPYIKWKWHSKYDTGITPHIDINKSYVIVEVHQSQNNSGLWYNVGRLGVDGFIIWSEVESPTERKFASGQRPKVTILDDSENPQIMVTYHDGKKFVKMSGKCDVSEGIITWEDPIDAPDVGPASSNTTLVDLNGNDLTITVSTKNTSYADSTLICTILHKDKSYEGNIKFQQNFFVEYNSSDPDSIRDDPSVMFASSPFSTNMQPWIQAMHKKNKIVRIYNFNSGNMVDGVNFPSTNYPEREWYSENTMKQKKFCSIKIIL